MTETNRLRMTMVRESTLGTTPGTPRMRTTRITGESLALRPDMVMSEEIREDGMDADPIKVGESNSGGVNFEFIYPGPATPLALVLESLFGSIWAQTPERDNDGTADSVLTGVTASTGVIACATGPAFVVGHLLRNTGYGIAGNNGLFRCTTGSATVPAVGTGLLTDESAPPATARTKAVGFQGVSGDITATATGLASTTLDFTTFALTPGRWLKIGGTGSAFRFAAEALNTWVRVAGTVTANAIPLDNLPPGWATDAGSSRTIRVFFGDQLRNGTTVLGQTIERGFMGQTTPSYVGQRGMVADTADIAFARREKVTMGLTFQGMSGTRGTTSLDAAPDAAPSVADFQVMAASANLGRFAENGVALSAPNWVQSIRLAVANNLRVITAVDDGGNAVDIRRGTQEVTPTVDAIFGNLDLYNKVMNMDATNLNWRLTKQSRAVVWGLPRVTPTGGTPSAGARNQDVVLSIPMRASADSVTGAHMLLDRFEFFQD